MLSNLNTEIYDLFGHFNGKIIIKSMVLFGAYTIFNVQCVRYVYVCLLCVPNYMQNLCVLCTVYTMAGWVAVVESIKCTRNTRTTLLI